MTEFSGDTLFMVLTKEDAVNEFRRLAGNKDPEQAKNEDPDRFDTQAQKPYWKPT